MTPAVVVVDSGTRRSVVRGEVLPSVFREMPDAIVAVVGGHRTRYPGALHVPFLNRARSGGWASKQRNLGCDLVAPFGGPVLVLEDWVALSPGFLASLRDGEGLGDVVWFSALAPESPGKRSAVFVRDWSRVPRWDETIVGDGALDAVQVALSRSRGLSCSASRAEVRDVGSWVSTRFEVPRDPVFGLMTTRNEVDIVDEGLDHWGSQTDGIFALDDSFDGTRDRLLGHPMVERVFTTGEVYPGWESSRDWMRERLLDEARRAYGATGWCAVAHPDLFLDFSLKAVLPHVAEDVLCAHVKHFFLKDPEDRGIRYDRRLSPSSQLSWCCDGFWECVAFKNAGGALTYSSRTHHRLVPDELAEGRFCSDPKLTARHYSFRDPRDVVERARDRMSRGWTTTCYAEIAERGDPFLSRIPGAGDPKLTV